MPRRIFCNLLIGTCFGLLYFPGIHGERSAGEAGSFIVQGSDVQAVKTAVLDVGGKVTHELGVIRSVGAVLTSEQRERLERNGSVEKIHPDRKLGVDTLSCALNGSGKREIKDGKLKWEITNTGLRSVTLNALSLRWPESNGAIRKVKFADAEIKDVALAPSSVTITRWPVSGEKRRIEPGKTERLEIEFSRYADRDQARYGLTALFAEGCAIEFAPSPARCAPVDRGLRELDDDKLKWELGNQGDHDLRIRKISLNWPEDNGWLEKAKYDGSEFADDELQPPVATIAVDWTDNDFELKQGDTTEIELEFDRETDPDAERYSIRVEFAEGCDLWLQESSLPVAIPEEPVAEVLPDPGFTGGGGGGSGGGDEGETLSDPSPTPSETLPEELVAGDKKARDTVFPSLVLADRLHRQGVTGRGVTVAIVDTGLWSKGGGSRWLRKNTRGDDRILAAYDALEDELVSPNSNTDGSGHGSHVAGIMASSRKTWGTNGTDGLYNGIAPDVDLVVIRAFDRNGEGSYLDVIRGIDFAVRFKDDLGIRVLNLSFSSPPLSYYWDDPLNQAVMAAWQAGITVVASAGNRGPEPMTVGVPGNVPYVITVGAVSDATTGDNPTDDFLATFSSAGPTFEGFVKPEVVAPGGHVLALMNRNSKIAKAHEDYHDGDSYYYMSGTSQATAMVSGAVALMLQIDPSLTPDDVKCRLMGSARPAIDTTSAMAYSLFQQGAGLIDAYAAARSRRSGCANRGLDLQADLGGTAHFGGRANRTPDGTYYLMGLEGEGTTWSNGYTWTGGLLWSDGLLWADAFLWNDGFLWADAYLWSDSLLWSDSFLWSDGLSETVSINLWVEQE